MRLTVNLATKNYDIIIERGLLHKIGTYINLNRKVLIVTDEGVPRKHIDTVLSQCESGFVHTVIQGEGAKSFVVLQEICKVLLEHNFSRKDLLIAVGGGVIGDLAGFAASIYMRGIPFVNIPTTTLSQIDSSIGGKVAVNFEGVKNNIGAFYHPEIVLIDSNTLATLSQRHYNNGLAEAVKAGLIYDKDLFELLETENVSEKIDEIIYRCLCVKKDVVEKDEKEENLRKILNFGHTLGHGIESVYGLSGLYHGECVAIGMLPMLEDEKLKQRTIQVLEKLSLPVSADYDKEKVFQVMCKDKKANGAKMTLVKVAKLGEAKLCDVDMESLKKYL